jgi:hypothetical protein
MLSETEATDVDELTRRLVRRVHPPEVAQHHHQLHGQEHQDVVELPVEGGLEHLDVDAHLALPPVMASSPPQQWVEIHG